MSNKALLLILDGWGIGKHDHSDAIFTAHTPVMDGLMATQPHSYLKTFGENVGLPEGQMGNSEVGHMNIGAGRIVYQMLVLINKAFQNETIKELEGFKLLLEKAKTAKKIHLMGLVSDGGVHSSIEHLKGLLRIFKQENLDEKVCVHSFLDGRDTDPKSGKRFLKEIIEYPFLGRGKMASVIGRYYAMDRDKRWERVKKAYDLLVHGTGDHSTNLLESLQVSYDSGTTDEFVLPLVATDHNGQALATIEEGDLVLCFNFRTDRGREITTALTQEAFHEYNMHPLNLDYFTMTEYDKQFDNVNIIFENQDLEMTMGEYLSTKGKTQLRGAETEKYPHVTFFFSGGREEPFEGEDRLLVPSPKVATYDLQPEMSAPELTEKLLEALQRRKHDFMCINYANPDMVGHTGVYEAIQQACETIDGFVGQVVEKAQESGYKVMIIADHGNADNAVNEDGSPNTAHSVNLVPCILVGQELEEMNNGILADVSPTILKMMALEQPESMTGKSLF